MGRTAVTVIACLVALATTVAPAHAAGNGMLAAVADGKIVTLNPDGSGLRTVSTPPSAGEPSGLAWSPDGNKLAFSHGGKNLVFHLVKSTAPAGTPPPPGAGHTKPPPRGGGARR